MSKSKSTPPRVRVERGLYKRDKTYFACATPKGAKSAVWKTLGEVNLSAARLARDEFAAEVRKTKPLANKKATFEEVAREWLKVKKALRDAKKLRPGTYTAYEGSLRLHVLPYLASQKVADMTADDVVEWVEEIQMTGQADWSIRKHWVALYGVLKYAARHGYAHQNVADLLTRDERPKSGPSRVRYLSAEEMDGMITHAPKRYRMALLMALLLGVRLGELLAIRWSEVDFAEGVVHITGQMDSKGERLDYAKTSAGHRSIVLMDTLAKALKAYKLASKFSGAKDYVICSEVGTPMNPRNLAQRGLEKACEAAGLEGVTFHVLRHTFASILIAQGHDAVYVADQLGHEKPSVTLDVYSHLFARARHAAEHRSRMDAEFGHLAAVK